MLYICGCASDYDGWGIPGFSYAELVELRKRNERNTNPTIAANTAFHSSNGSVTVSDYGSTEPYEPIWKNAFIEKGYQVNADCNTGTCNGHATIQGTIKNGERMSSGVAHLLANKNRTNLFIAKNSFVRNLVYDTANPLKVKGVNIQTVGTGNCATIQVKANKEVIVSAGAYGSPKLLLLSGIGKPADLPTTPLPAVPLKVNLPVGENLQDHVYGVKFIQVNPNAPSQTVEDVIIDCYDYFFLNRTGNFSNLGLMSSQGFINTINSTEPCGDVQFIPYKFRKSQQYFGEILDNFGLTGDYINQIVSANRQSETILVFVIVLKPNSTGTVKLATTATGAVNGTYTLPPKIDHKYFSDTTWPNGTSADKATMIRGINKLAELMNSTAMQATNATFFKFNISECNAIPYPSDEYFSCELKYITASMWHPTGSCKMGTSPASSVVDPNFKVHSIENLRVVDGSIFPSGLFLLYFDSQTILIHFFNSSKKQHAVPCLYDC
jgi:choline dehydrogenase